MIIVEPPLSVASARITVDIDPEAGGRLSQLRVDGTPLLIGSDEVPATLRLPDGRPAVTAWGAYPMVPWAGRIRRGRFTFRGREYTLPVDDEGHALHGVGHSSAWIVTEWAPDRARLRLDLPTDARWPFGGQVEQDVSTTDDGLELRMTVTAGDRAFPVSFGWHPWFRKPSRFRFHPARMYRRDREGITLDELVDVPPGPWDDCFTNSLPVGITIDGVDLQLTSDCSHWVVYDEMPHATCVEPQTGPPDAFTIAPRVLEAGGSLGAWFRIALVAP